MLKPSFHKSLQAKAKKKKIHKNWLWFVSRGSDGGGEYVSLLVINLTRGMMNETEQQSTKNA